MTIPNSSKVVVMGDISVGKSSILTKYIKGSFDEFNESTIGAAFLSKNYDNEKYGKLKLEMWDTAGQERYDSLLPMYYRGANVIILVYSLNNSVSFHNIKNRWLEKINDHTLDALIFVVGNKSDLRQNVTDEQINEFINDEPDIEHFKVSAKTNSGLDALFNRIVQKAIEHEKFTFVKKINIMSKPLVEKKGCCR